MRWMNLYYDIIDFTSLDKGENRKKILQDWVKFL